MQQLPPWQPLDGVPVPPARSGGSIVAVVAAESAVEAGWAASAAVDLARAWSARGEKVILADGALHYPSLHDELAVQNGEGLTDAALFGASVGRVAQAVDGGAFFLIPAGTAVADANSVPGSGRWSRLLEGFKEAGVRLLLFVRDGDSGCAAFLGSASDIVVLASRGGRSPSSVRDLEGLVRAVTGPAAVPGSDLRPPAEWTAATPDGRRRVLLLVLAVVIVVAVLVLAFSSIDLFGLPVTE